MTLQDQMIAAVRRVDHGNMSRRNDNSKVLSFLNAYNICLGICWRSLVWLVYITAQSVSDLVRKQTKRQGQMV